MNAPRHLEASPSRLKLFVVLNACLLFLFLLVVLPNSARPQQTAPPLPPAQNEYETIRVSVNLVVLHATVQNRDRTPVSGLTKADFQIFEDGVLQQIESFSSEDIPVTVGLVVDNSGSMDPKIREVVAAGLAFARSSHPADQMFVVNFNERVTFGLAEGIDFTDKEAELKLALGRIRADGLTALYDALAVSLDHLGKGNQNKKVLVVLSDGNDNASKHTLKQIQALAEQSNVIIYTVGLFEQGDPDKNPGVLRQLAKSTGGEAFLPYSLKELVGICERIAQDIRTQYTLTYKPTNTKLDGSYRAIQVKASAEGHGRINVRTRTGYRVPLKFESLPAASNRP